MRRIGKYHIVEYVRENGDIPFSDWKGDLDVTVRARIQARLLRVSQGNLGDYEPIRNGVYEFRFHFGAGPRVYFGFDNNEIILLLCGGIKRGQSKDINLAEALWQEYLKRKEEDE
jgi:putative addiction module killer protein